MSISEGVPILAFELSGGQLGLHAGQVQEVVRAAEVSRLPCAPDVVEGVVNYRGEIIPVLDIRRRFGLPAAPLDPSQHLIIARAGARTVALRVDRALDLLSLPRDAITRSPVDLPGVDHVAGVAPLPDGALVIQDLERFLDLEEARQLDAALQVDAAS